MRVRREPSRGIYRTLIMSTEQRDLDIVPISGASNPFQVGQKFARQHLLHRASFPIPSFFCLTGDSFRRTILPIRSDIARALADTDYGSRDSIQRTSNRIRALFSSLPIGPHLEHEIYRAFDHMFPQGTEVAVRASIIGDAADDSEDSEANPFAGLSETHLYVQRDQLLDRIRRCWASCFSVGALVYRSARGMNPSRSAVAVGVQAMIPGKRSFVAFTCNPKTTARDTVIVAGYGIGEGIVQERVGADHYFVNPVSGAIERKITCKEQMLCRDPARAGELVAQDVPVDLRNRACLSDAEVERVANIARDIERVFGSPQDIEGTFTEDGALHVLQSRPIAFDFRRIRVWSNANVSESFPGVTTALTYSMASHFYESVFYDYIRRMGGADERTLRDNAPAFRRMLGFIDGRVYHSLSNLLWVNGINPVLSLGPFKRDLEEVLQLDSSIYIRLPGERQSFESLPAYGGALTRALVYSGARALTLDRNFARFAEWWQAMRAELRTRDLTKEDPLVLIAEFRRVWKEAGNRWGITLTNHSLINTYFPLARKLILRWTDEKDPNSLLSGLLCGGEPHTSVRILLSAVRLAELIRKDARLSTLFETEEVENIWQDFEAANWPDDIVEAFQKHLRDYGDRGIQELNMERENLRETPWELVRLLRAYVRRRLTVEELIKSDGNVRKEAEARLEVLLAGHPLRIAAIRFVLDHLRRVIAHREDSRFWRGELFGHCKKIFKILGQRLVERDVLATLQDNPSPDHRRDLRLFRGSRGYLELARARRSATARIRAACKVDPTP
ncbi:phosphoenolpyruvate synthase [Pendulispora brunnea]|uniref:Phosphoenolpyruvate synthase n=1 Tax=Pendulispora brunnea TaxID=2905690 RepID=A0ABZ2KD04_9BACT